MTSRHALVRSLGILSLFLLAGCAARAPSTVATASSPSRMLVPIAERGSLLVHHEAKTFATRAERDGCGGDYDVTTWVEADAPTADTICVHGVTFSGERGLDLAFGSALEIGASGTKADRITDMLVRTDNAGRTFVTFPVNRTFRSHEVSFRHSVTPAHGPRPAHGLRDDTRCALMVVATLAPGEATR